MLGLLSSIAITSCSNDEPATSSTEKIMETISGCVFHYNDISVSNNSFHEYQHYIMFTATSASGGIFEHELIGKDVYLDETNRGRKVDEGSFSVEDGKISISMYRGDTWYIKYFTVVGKDLMGDNGDIYQFVGLSSDENTPTVDSHYHPLNYYQTQYNFAITRIMEAFQSLEIAKELGNTNRARQYYDEIKELQKIPPLIREDAKKDGWTIEASPYETKKAYL